MSLSRNRCIKNFLHLKAKLIGLNPKKEGVSNEMAN